MTTPVKLRIIMGENNSEKLTLPSGIPESVEDLKLEILLHLLNCYNCMEVGEGIWFK